MAINHAYVAPHRFHPAALGLGLAMAWALLAAARADAAQPTFPTPDAALQAFVKAATDSDGKALVDLLGPEHQDEIIGGDPASRRVELQRLSEVARAGAVLAPGKDGRMTIVLGREAWPMPVPLVHDTNGWRFDTVAGLEEIEDRRIGRNELNAIALLRDYVDAQVKYASADHDGDEVLEYAQRIASTPGKHDGLYWEAAPGEEVSPFGPYVAQASEYLSQRHTGEPYYGYYFKVLTRQGANPPGGAYDYIINGNMIAGFGLLAWPADYGNSGIMTFVVNQQGKVFEKDLGPETGKIAPGIKAYDPDHSWTLVEPE